MAKQATETTSYGAIIVLSGTWPHGNTLRDIERLATSGALSVVTCEWTPYGNSPLAERMAATSERAREKHKKDSPCQLVTLAPDRWLLVDDIAA